MVTDPIADMLTRVRNALRNRVDEVSMPHSRVRAEIAQVLKREGYIRDIQTSGEGISRLLTLQLKYGVNGEQVIRRIDRVSTVGRRFYRGLDRIPKVLDGLGIMVISTSKGILSDREARKMRVGGELICRVW
jgi:small subunit ribosomal protein S8